MKNIEPLVTKTMADHFKTRGNDKLLMLFIWKTEGLVLTEEQATIFLKCCSSPETIRRTRQKIQAEGLLLPDGVTLERRKKKAQEMHDKFKHKTFYFDKEKEIFVEV